MNIIKLNEIPSGCQVIVAIMSYWVIIKKTVYYLIKVQLIEDYFYATIYHTEKDEDKKIHLVDEEIRCKPDKEKTKKY